MERFGSMAIGIARTMTFYFALTDSTDTTWTTIHQRNDEDVIAFELVHSEGDFPTITATIKNPRRPWLTPDMNVWVWFAKDNTPFFFGRLVSSPEELSRELIRLVFVARPPDYETVKRAFADTLKVRPFWDEIWLNEDHVDEPDTVLEARSQLWHIDRTSLAVTVSDIINGEDGTITIDNFFYDSLDVSHGSMPLRKVRVEAEVSWDQMATGTVDATAQLVEAFRIAGSTPPRISSFTGQGLHDDWPEEGDDLKGGWSIGETTLLRVDGISAPQRYKDVTIQPVAEDDLQRVYAMLAPPKTARFYIWEFVPKFNLAYEAKRQKIEYLSFDLEADMQAIFTEPGDDESQLITLQSKRISEPIDPGGSLPIGKLYNRAYFLTDRGRQSLEYLLMVARARLLSNSRAIEISASYTFDFGLQFSCRKNAVIVDPRIPNGQASGKIIRYSLVANNDGELYSTVTIGCAVGKGNTVVAVPGETDYADDDWDEDYQIRIGEWVMPLANEITYADYSDTSIIDDNVNFDKLDLNPLIIRLDVINGETVQKEVLDNPFIDIPAAVEALNASFTEVWLELEPLNGGEPFETTYNIAVSGLQVPRMIDLEGI